MYNQLQYNHNKDNIIAKKDNTATKCVIEPRKIFERTRLYEWAIAMYASRVENRNVFTIYGSTYMYNLVTKFPEE